MSKINNSNYNKISVKTDSMVKMIEQLSKLGVFKEKRKSRAKKTTSPVDEIKQDSDMVGYVKSLAGQAGRGDPNLFSLRQVEPGMSQQQIRDITERNNAGVAALRAEVRQQRLEDIEQQQGQRFADITRLGGIMNPILERFRGAQEPGAGQRVDPFKQSNTIEEIEPDIQEETFTQTLNEGGPEAVSQLPTSIFPQEETSNIIPVKEYMESIYSAPPNLQPREKVGVSKKKKLVLDPQDVSDELDLGKIPTMRNSYTAVENYYIALTDATDTDRDASLDSKSKILADINKILAEKGEELLNE